MLGRPKHPRLAELVHTMFNNNNRQQQPTTTTDNNNLLLSVERLRNVVFGATFLVLWMAPPHDVHL